VGCDAVWLQPLSHLHGVRTEKIVSTHSYRHQHRKFCFVRCSFGFCRVFLWRAV